MNRCRLEHSSRIACLAALIALVAANELRAADWPFAPPTRPAVPPVRDHGWVRNPLDGFVLARLEKAGLRPNSEADKLTLLRRVTFDLTGLAPTPAERAAFLADRSPDAYERLVDRLLASPQFGERWAQHWLDLVRYAESDGFKLDRLRPDAYRYRDYVIRSLNADLPYDRFIRQQLAGDEAEPDNPDAIVATGFYRMPPEETNASNYRMMRQELLDDVTEVFGLTFLGLTVGCARCHDHKFDPITQKDHYRLQAVFAPLVQRDNLPLVSARERTEYERRVAAWNEATRTIRTEEDAMLGPVRKEVFAEQIAIFDPETQEALKLPPEKRTPLQQQLAVLASKQMNRRYSRMYRRLPPKVRAHYDELEKKLEVFDHLKPSPLPTAMAVADVGAEAPPTHRLGTGNYLKPREEVQPGFPECIDAGPADVRPPASLTNSTGRRTALAAWLTRPDHPLTARVIVNRLWQHHLGRGIVATPNDFGAMGEKPTHPELLDYLATELVRHGWRLKAIHRLIVTSATYRQASSGRLNPTAAAAARSDPENQLLWHARVKRREAESVRDGVLQASGQLNLRMFGPSAQPELPPAVMENRYSWDPDPRPEDRNRRSIYVIARRNLPYPLFAAFDAPDRHNSCPARTNTVTGPQALVMLNGEAALTQARQMAGRLLADRGTDVPGLVRQAYLRLLGREPAPDEVAAARQFLERQRKVVAPGPASDLQPQPLPAGVDSAFAAAVVDLCHALMNSAEFLEVE
jgi:hypothetical protein